MCVCIDTGRAPDFAGRIEKRWGTRYTNHSLVGLFLSPSRCPHSPRTLVNLLRHVHICWELSQCVIAYQAELFYQTERVEVCWVPCVNRVAARLTSRFLSLWEMTRDMHVEIFKSYRDNYIKKLNSISTCAICAKTAIWLYLGFNTVNLLIAMLTKINKSTFTKKQSKVEREWIKGWTAI